MRLTACDFYHYYRPSKCDLHIYLGADVEEIEHLCADLVAAGFIEALTVR